MTLILTADQQSTLTAVFKDANGVDMAPDLTDPHAPQPLWTEDSKQTVVMLLPSDDKLSCEVIAIAPGTANVTVTDGGTNKQVTENVIVRERGIHSVTISAATPVKQGEALPPQPLPVEPFEPQLPGAGVPVPASSVSNS